MQTGHVGTDVAIKLKSTTTQVKRIMPSAMTSMSKTMGARPISLFFCILHALIRTNIPTEICAKVVIITAIRRIPSLNGTKSTTC